MEDDQNNSMEETGNRSLQTIQLRDRLNGQQHKNCPFRSSKKKQPHQCKTLVVKVHPVHQNDPRKRSIEDDKLQRSAPTIQRPIGRENKRRLHLGNWAISTHRDDEDGKRKGTIFPTITPSLRTI